MFIVLIYIVPNDGPQNISIAKQRQILGIKIRSVPPMNNNGNIPSTKIHIKSQNRMNFSRYVSNA